MTSENNGKKEWDVINNCLPSLLLKGCLTGIEYRKIASTKNLSERKCAIYDLVMSKSDEEASQLIAVIRNATQVIRDKNNSANPNKQKENDLPSLLATNPFLNPMVIKNVYEFLRLEDVKNCRFVCREWNSTAITCLRKRAQIHFRRNILEPSAFLEIFEDSLPDLPFAVFKFSSEGLPWSVGEIQEFCEKCGKNIKELRLEGLILTERMLDSEMFLSNYDVSRWIANCSKIAILKIDSHKNNATELHISLDKLTSIKTVALRRCQIDMYAQIENTPISPNSISLTDVSITRGGRYLGDYPYESVINFSQTKFVRLLTTGSRFDGSYPKFDMNSQVFNTNRLRLYNFEIENWAKAKGEIQSLHLEGIDFVQKSELKIKQLAVSGNHVIDLSALPQTIEKLKLLETNRIICTSQPIDLPNIKYLLFQIVDSNSLLLTHFTNCSNLTELELSGSKDVGKLCLSYIPKSVKKVKLNCVHLKFADYSTLELETLILKDSKHISRYNDFANIINKMKAKNLVVVVTNKTQLFAADIWRLVEAYNDQCQKIIIGTSKDMDLLKETYFEGSAISKHFDGKSNYYLFENKFGKSIPQTNFDLFKTMDDIKMK